MRAVLALVLFTCVLSGGCNFFKTDRTRLLSPDKVIDSKTTGSPINPIYSSVGPTDTAQELVPNATFPAEGDWSYVGSDYIIGPTDVVNVSILDVYMEGLETILQRQVSYSGYIDLPLLNKPVLAEGKTSDQLKEAIIRAYRPEILKDPVVAVTLISQRQATFSILGAVARPGPYPIIRKDMRLVEALAIAGGIAQYNIRYIYVIRSAPAVRANIEAAQAEPQAEAAAEEQPESAPGERPINVEDALRILGGGASAPKDQPAQSVMPSYAETAAVMAGGGDSAPQSSKPAWVYKDGEWVAAEPQASEPAKAEAQPVQPEPQTVQPEGRPAGAAVAAKPGEPAPAQPAAGEEQEDPFGWRKLDQSGQARIIAINLPELEAGSQRMNVIIRENDVIQVPTLQIGEFYVIGEVSRPGPYSLTGRRVTLKMAMAAAGNLGPLAWPENSMLVRRVGQDQEQIFPIDLEAIFHGEEPDIFLKPDDIIAVGTDVKASFYAVFRNAFRLTYGFGFIWDRNFANPLEPNYPVDSKRFTRW